MLCQSCNKNEATIYYKKTQNNKTSEYHLCGECAKKLEQNGEIDFGPNPFGEGLTHNYFDTLFNTDLAFPFFSPSPAVKRSQGRRCSGCGMSYSQIMSAGTVGCPECYRSFEKELSFSVARLHGKEGDLDICHSGRVPHRLKSSYAKKNTLQELERKLKEAIEAQEFEKAAQYRDEIRNMKEEANGDGLV